jgi:N utilization substance protein B
MGDRSTGRKLAFKALFQLGFKFNTIDQVVATLLESGQARPAAREFARALAVGCSDHLADIDAAIKEHSKNWDLNRLGNSDRAALRLGTYELLYTTDIPYEVVINEAVELAKNFGDEASAGFVNGILDEIRKASAAAETRWISLCPRRDAASP